jgi:hypothetical protein
MSKLELKKTLSSMDKADLITLVLELYETKKEFKEYLDYYVSPNEKEQFLKYKQIIEKEYFPSSGNPKTRLSVAKKAIADFSKLKPSPDLEAELLIFLVECGCKFTESYGDLWESFYDGMATNFNRALKFMHKHDLLEKFRPNAEACVKAASDCGCGFSDSMGDIFYEYYGG